MKEIVQPVVNFDLSSLPFMSTHVGEVCGVHNCRITRCGYTGEDGVEARVFSLKYLSTQF